MSLGVWLEAERKCSATMVGLDLLLFKKATVFIQSAFYFVISHVRDTRECSACVNSVVWSLRQEVGQHSFFDTVYENLLNDIAIRTFVIQ